MRSFGPCPTCGEMFQSRDRKIFCSMTCYHRSPQFKAMIAANTERQTRREERSCPGCGAVFATKPSSNRRYCTKLCWRKYFAARHDRWVANPQTIALPQDYDEFLSKDELPCIIEGCEWVGKSLSMHVNQVHGISAAKFKELAGFNHRTGVISADMQEMLQGRPYEHLRSAEARESVAEQLQQMRKMRQEAQQHGPQLRTRLEHREHMRKVLAERRATAPGETYHCQRCGKPFFREGLKRRVLYCNACGPSQQREVRRVRSKSLTCAQCGCGFLGSASQQRRVDKGLPVVCSMDCRQQLGRLALIAGAKANNASRRKLRGPCPTCGEMFYKKGPVTIYCSSACYYQSNTFKTLSATGNAAKRDAVRPQ